MNVDETAEVRRVLSDIPRLAGHDRPINRLGGLTNRVYRVGDYVLRIPGRGTEDYINRTHELEIARIAQATGVGPAILFADAKTGVMVSRFIADAVTMSPAAFRDRDGSAARAAAALRQLHTSGSVFPVRFELFSMIDSYLSVLGSKAVDVPAGYSDVLREAQVIRQAIAARPVPPTPCHCDPLCENFLDTGNRMWIVDWEYAGMNDPMWDLADLSVEGQFDSRTEAELLSSYFSGQIPPEKHARVIIFKAMCDLLWTLWGLIQHASGNTADDFMAYATTRFVRCQALMAQPDFARHVRLIERVT
jgi:thiamine kinase-like enzyme